MEQIAFSTVATTGIPRFRSCPLNVRKDETEIISSTLNVKSDVCLINIFYKNKPSNFKLGKYFDSNSSKLLASFNCSFSKNVNTMI